VTAPSALFVREGGSFVPTEIARGPWDPGALHGGPVAALVGGLVAAHDPAPDGTTPPLVRMAVDLLRPVPLAPLTVDVRTTRPGRKVQLVEASMTAGDVEVLRARGLRVRALELEVEGVVADDVAPPGPEHGRRPDEFRGEWEAFHNRAVTMSYVEGSFESPGPATVWVRLDAAVVEGEEVTPFQRVAATADFGNGVSAAVSWEDFTFINPDLTVTVARPAEGEWVCLRARTFPGPLAAGFAESEIFDRRGRVGRAVQSILLERRPSPSGGEGIVEVGHA
jgi:hypothetical protein